MTDRDAPDEAPDYRALFESAPGRYLVLTPDLTIVAVSDAYLRATMTTREAITGRAIFEVFPDNPHDPQPTGVANLRRSIERVLRERVADTMAVQKYDIRRPAAEGGGFEERYWSPVNAPVFDAQGRVRYVIHRVEDVTEFVRARAAASAPETQLREHAAAMELEILARSQELQRANEQLRAANAALAAHVAERAATEREIRSVHAFLDSIIENMPAMIFVKDAERLRFERVNRAAEHLIGQPREALLGKSDFDLFPREQAEFFQSEDRETLATGVVRNIPSEPITTAGGTRWLHTRKIPLPDAEGTPRHLLGISLDVTEQRRAEHALRHATERAEDANRELEAFSYSVAHDLRAPLRSIDGFSQALLEDYASQLDEQGREYLGFVRADAQRMGRLIDDLLHLARVTRAELVCDTVDVSAAAERVLARLRAVEPARRVETHVQPGLRARADARLLEVVLDNLLGNAWKFSARVSRARIEVVGETHGDEITLVVRDNGAGFDMAYADKLFGAFQRLHSANEFEGTGIGLATVQRIVRRHGGRVWAEASVGRGAAFSFTLPAATPADPG